MLAEGRGAALQRREGAAQGAAARHASGQRRGKPARAQGPTNTGGEAEGETKGCKTG